MSLSRRNYESIADLLHEERTCWHDTPHEALECIAEGLADYFEQDNPRFDRALFLHRAGVVYTSPEDRDRWHRAEDLAAE